MCIVHRNPQKLMKSLITFCSRQITNWSLLLFHRVYILQNRCRFSFILTTRRCTERMFGNDQLKLVYLCCFHRNVFETKMIPFINVYIPEKQNVFNELTNQNDMLTELIALA